MPSCVSVRKRRNQQRAGVGGHVQTVGDERYRAEHRSSDNLGDHHQPA